MHQQYIESATALSHTEKSIISFITIFITNFSIYYTELTYYTLDVRDYIVNEQTTDNVHIL